MVWSYPLFRKCTTICNFEPISIKVENVCSWKSTKEPTKVEFQLIPLQVLSMKIQNEPNHWNVLVPHSAWFSEFIRDTRFVMDKLTHFTWHD